ncbi:MAG: PD40 domain-containing protein [Bacteroidia bacterium]|nr:PD40 domain-containing protein [Bacteroidia bacterium]NNF29842.1 OmpA family protein [Flavobacteriaceae bacterium]MBT8275958.1 PD40 domain-containing protein [Bacteroidia bacterium]NNJ82996.1 OmpA family protein [Flavobacteriaceae bacterium]NNK53798.1 OmpA family protein [Flavobacteriaceae bacterium]
MTLRSKYFLLIVAGLLLTANVTIAQDGDTSANTKEAKGDAHFNDFAFMDARDAYIKAVESGYRSVNVLSRLGDSYYFNGEYADAAKWYGALFAYSEDIDSEYIYRYAQSLKTIGKYATADRIMDKLNEVASTDDRGELFSEERNYLKLIELQSGRFNVFNVPFNSELSDFAPSLNGGEIIFTSNRKTRTASQRLHDWNDQPFSELYSITVSGDGVPNRYRSKVNSRYHESSAVFSKDGQTMYFTRNNYTNRKRGKDGAGKTLLKLYRSKRTAKGWGEAEELPFNSDDFSNGHPALSADGKHLIFASDRPGGEGQSDLYKVSIDGDSFGEPESLGDAVNTEGRETFPFIDTNGDLYFASDGHVGLGGLDVFVAEMNSEGNYEKGFNIGDPINSKADDFSFVINSTTGLGYFASNREGGKGEDDIYSFEQTAQLIKNCRQSLSGEVRDEDTDDLIANAKVVLLDSDNNVLEETKSDMNGAFSFDVIECSTGYAIRASKPDFSTSEKSFVTTGEYESDVKKTLYLLSEEDNELRDAKIGEDLGVLLNLNPIYFDLSQSYIRPDAQIELLKVVEAMQKFPNLKIDVRSHTDSRSSDAFNMKLSDARAKSTINYLVGAGVSPDRVTGRGYGESQLLNRCANGVQCSEADHQLNRRSEFIIVQK